MYILFCSRLNISSSLSSLSWWRLMDDEVLSIVIVPRGDFMITNSGFEMQPVCHGKGAEAWVQTQPHSQTMAHHHLLTFYLLGPLIVIIAFLGSVLLWFLNKSTNQPSKKLASLPSSTKGINHTDRILQPKSFVFDIEFQDLGLVLGRYGHPNHLFLPIVC